MNLWAALFTGLTVAMLVGGFFGIFSRPDDEEEVQLRVSLTEALTPQRLRRSRIDLILHQAGMHISATTFVFLCVAVSLMGALFVLSLTDGIWALGFMGGVASGSFPFVYLGHLQRTRRKEITRAWPDGVMDLRASLISGRSVHQSLVALSEGGPEPLRRAFSRYPVIARVGDTLTALAVIKDELGEATSDRVIEVLMLAHERGGGVVIEALDALGEMVTHDVRTAAEIDVDSLELRIQGWAIVFLPWALLIFLVLGNEDFREYYKTNGLLVLVVGGVLDLVGVGMIRLLSRRPIEPRVLTVGAYVKEGSE